MMHKDKLNIAIIGAGMIGKEHARALHTNPRARVAWICDINREEAESLAREYGATPANDYRKALEDKNVDAVVVATPPWLHKQMTLDSLSAGKHVLCEKPLAIFPKDAEKMVYAAESKGLVLADCSARHARLNPKFRLIHKLMQQKRFGNVYFIKYTSRLRRERSGIEYHPAAKWFLDKSKAGGGVAIDWGVYDLSFIYGLFDDKLVLKDAVAFGFHGVNEVNAGTPVFNTEEHLGAMLHFQGGLNVMWETALACHGASKSQIEIFGSRGGLSGGPLTWDPIDLVFYDDGPSGPRNTPLQVEGMDEHGSDLPHIDRDFVNALLEGMEPAMPGRCAARILNTIDAIYRSAGLR